MSETNQNLVVNDSTKKDLDNEKICFVIMPISNHEAYDIGHFDRVYTNIFKPAIIKAGFIPKRADECDKTNVIILDIIDNIIKADMVICDLSTSNPNVMYELGIRQAYDRPVTLVKDKISKRIFDIERFSRLHPNRLVIFSASLIT